MKFVQGVTGDSIIHTLTKACHIANHEREAVLLEINDVILYLDKEINLDNLWKKYQQKLDFKFEIQRLKRARQK